jgi:surface protein
MSTRYGQKTAPSSIKRVPPSFVSYNRNDPVYNGVALPIRTETPAYSRPSDYITMPAIANTEQKAAFLVFISDNNSNFLAFSATGNYNVDWGDGSVEDVATGVTASHSYNFSTYDPTNTTLTSSGFKQAIVIVTPQAGQNLLTLNLTIRHPSTAAANTYNQPIEEMYISGPNLTGLTLSSAAVWGKKTSYVNLINTGTITSFVNLFVNFYGLQKIDIGKTAAVTSTSGMFNTCYALKQFSTSSDTNFASNANTSLMFSACQALTTVPLFDTVNVTNMVSMFQGCYSLTSVPLFDTRSVTNMTSMFQSCYCLISVPLFDTRNVTVMTSMFQLCYYLTTVPLFDTRSVITMTSMFNTCYSLVVVPLFNTINVTGMSSMFNTCLTLKSVPLLDTRSVTNMTTMFSSCYNLVSIPLFDTRSVTTMSGMFNTCVSLVTVPLFNTTALTVMTSMFQFCYSLASVPLFNTATVTLMNSMFFGCSYLKTVPLFNTQNVTSMDSMFSSCFSLTSVPAFNTIKVTSVNNMFVSCLSLTTIPTFNLVATSVINGMFNNCQGLVAVPALNVNTVSAGFSSIFASCFSLSSILVTNIKYTIDFTNNKLSKENLETIFANAGTAQAGATRTMTLTNNWGAPTPVSLSGTPTAGSVVILMASTTGLSTGMQVTGTNTSLTTGRAVTFTDAGDLVNLTAHGLSDGDEVSFSVVTTTTGIVINTIYFVVGSTTDTFQVAATAGGAALPLTTNGSGTVKYNSTIVSIVPNVSVTMSRPMAASGAQTLAFRLLGTYKALLKGFAITG